MRIKFNKEALEEEGNSDIGCFVILFGAIIFFYFLFNYPLQIGIFLLSCWVLSIILRIFRIEK